MSPSKPSDVPPHVLAAIERAPAALREADRLVGYVTSPARRREIEPADALAATQDLLIAINKLAPALVRRKPTIICEVTAVALDR